MSILHFVLRRICCVITQNWLSCFSHWSCPQNWQTNITSLPDDPCWEDCVDCLAMYMPPVRGSDLKRQVCHTPAVIPCMWLGKCSLWGTSNPSANISDEVGSRKSWILGAKSLANFACTVSEQLQVSRLLWRVTMTYSQNLKPHNWTAWLIRRQLWCVGTVEVTSTKLTKCTSNSPDMKCMKIILMLSFISWIGLDLQRTSQHPVSERR